MTVLIIFLILMSLAAAAWIAVHFFPRSHLGVKIRLVTVGTVLFFMRRILAAVKLIDHKQIPGKEKKREHKEALKSILILMSLAAAAWIAVHFFPRSHLGVKIRLVTVGTVLFFMRRILAAVKLIDQKQIPGKEKKREHKEALKSILIPVALIFLILTGIAAMVYPVLSSLYMEKVQSQIQSQYHSQMTDSDSYVRKKLWEDADTYNRKLASGELSLLTPEENGYWDQLLVPGGSQIMGYIHIPEILVDLPIFHGVAPDTLEAGCGHMPQSSLPIGGESTHSVLSAHTGMASAPMFSDLPRLSVGDRFFIEILGQTLTYEIQSEADIRTVLPVEVQAVQIKSGQDLCTLVTCVPFGVNSHRLLVTGHRVPTLPEGTDSVPIPDPPEKDSPSLWRAQYMKSLWTGLGILGLILTVGAGACLFIPSRKKGNYEN